MQRYSALSYTLYSSSQVTLYMWCVFPDVGWYRTSEYPSLVRSASTYIIRPRCGTIRRPSVTKLRRRKVRLCNSVGGEYEQTRRGAFSRGGKLSVSIGNSLSSVTHTWLKTFIVALRGVVSLVGDGGLFTIQSYFLSLQRTQGYPSRLSH